MCWGGGGCKASTGRNGGFCDAVMVTKVSVVFRFCSLSSHHHTSMDSCKPPCGKSEILCEFPQNYYALVVQYSVDILPRRD